MDRRQEIQLFKNQAAMLSAIAALGIDQHIPLKHITRLQSALIETHAVIADVEAPGPVHRTKQPTPPALASLARDNAILDSGCGATPMGEFDAVRFIQRLTEHGFMVVPLNDKPPQPRSK